ncbi:Glutaredoxin [Onchocerca flexuosa]|uniref:Glutaredoxin n=1 Tax=Onchocerca flexuosa TaxID=387005 RepID=A0A238C5A5_9BILA|nr:Glutaredoxin [Onchocerca flexuosa]
MGSLFSKYVPQDVVEVRRFIDELIASKKIVVISKSWCIYCIRARKVLTAYPLRGDAMEWIDINKRSDGKEILDYMEQITGSRTVPRIFIGGHFFGGCDEVCKAKKNGALEQKLNEVGAI